MFWAPAQHGDAILTHITHLKVVAQQAWQQHSAVAASSPSRTNGNEHKDLPSNSTDPIAIKHPWDVLQQAWSTEAKIMLAVCVDSRCHHRTSSNVLCLYLDLFTLFYIRWYFCKLVAFSCGMVFLSTQKTPSQPKCITTNYLATFNLLIGQMCLG